MPDWIHTIRGVRLVEGTLPRIADGLFKVARQLEIANEGKESLEQVQSERLAATQLLTRLVEAASAALWVEEDKNLEFVWPRKLQEAIANAQSFLKLRKEDS